MCTYLSGCTTVRPAEAHNSMLLLYISTPREIMRSRRQATMTCDAPVPLALKRSRWTHRAKCRMITWTPSNRMTMQISSRFLRRICPDFWRTNMMSALKTAGSGQISAVQAHWCLRWSARCRATPPAMKQAATSI